VRYGSVAAQALSGFWDYVKTKTIMNIVPLVGTNALRQESKKVCKNNKSAMKIETEQVFCICQGMPNNWLHKSKRFETTGSAPHDMGKDRQAVKSAW
jgi:hypothetical protein